EHSDADGIVLPDPASQPRGYQWLAIARTGSGRLAHLGFQSVWYRGYDPGRYAATKTFAITDRPVYRPEQTVRYKIWVRGVSYEHDGGAEFAGQSFRIEIRDPRREKIAEHELKADAYGGLEGEMVLAADAALGVYGLTVHQGKRTFGGGSFRVEEYKKPEFEVTVDAPEEPARLGETIEATIRARYYFGSPVTQARVKYKVLRTARIERWFPPRPWDWLYGSGYWWSSYDYDWYPGFDRWGCRRPAVWWWGRPSEPPEVIAAQEVDIGPDGTVKVEIDTALAQELHPDQDHTYSITAEVVDASRRTIVGAGSVVVARRPFEVRAWVDRGYYRVGDTIRASFAARRADGKPVAAKGALKLLKVTYENGEPLESEVQSWPIETGEDGHGTQVMTASAAGQYRLSSSLTDAAGHEIEGAHLFTITGEGFDGSQFRFHHLELVPDRLEYAPGEAVHLQVNTDRAGAAVLLFERPVNGVYPRPSVIRRRGKSSIHDIAVARGDMPNFFVEAVTVAGGRVHTEIREIHVPPEKRIVNVEVEPSGEEYRPGEKARVKITLRDLSGEPLRGAAVVTIYDKAVEYISGGSNVPEIKAFFWKWRRSHRPQSTSSLDRRSAGVYPRGAVAMANVGIFGATVAEEMDALSEGGTQAGIGGGRGGADGAVRRSLALGADAAPGGPPAPAAAMAKGEAAGGAAFGMNEAGEGAPGAEEALAPAAVRTEFADTALWVGSLETDEQGSAEVELDMPENLTTWRIKAWAMGEGTRVGEGAVDVVTRKDLILRMQAPRFFVQRDEVVLSANVHNYLAGEKTVRAAIELDGPVLELLGDAVQTVAVKPEGEARIDWRVRVLEEGEAIVRMKALTDEESDAMEMRFPAFVHGMLRTESFSRAIEPDGDSASFAFTVPAERRPAQSRLEVRYSPTIAGALVDALPYLADYPYGCTEQTLNRFLPAVITQKILIEMGLDLEQVRRKRANLNPQEIGDPADRAGQWKRFKRNPVFDADEVQRMVKQGVQRLTEMQLSDGGWGWFSGWGERSSPHTTAVVVHGLQIALQNDVALVPGVLEKGVAWLERYQKEEVRKIENSLLDPRKKPWKGRADNLDALVYMVLVDAGVASPKMLEFLYRDRTRLAVYSLAMLGCALEAQGEKEKLGMVLRNIGQYLVTDDENQTAWLELPAGFWWYWYGSEFEAHAYYLKLLARTDPRGPAARRIAKYLINNRKHATYWNSTRDTALCIEALADFLRASGEDRPEMTVEVRLDGELRKAVEITPQTLFLYDDRFVLEGDALAAGEHRVEVRRQGKGPLYISAYATTFTLEELIPRAGLEVKVDRKYYRLERVDARDTVAGSRGQVVEQAVEKYERKVIEDLALLKSGDLVEIELEIESKNDYEYLIFEDMKPAGFEPVDLRSGYTGNALGAYVEFRDERVVFFVRWLARGRHSASYRMRA
ncbi:MAG: alpha-2-macroglobulin, partial [Planctomycetes bacterium]|nr:alpha-2-macroglobulin [Planctomycetota bacterium]